MIIIGEKLNSSIPSALEGLNQKSKTFVTELAARQAQAGAQFLDLNTGMCEDEGEMLVWAAKLVREAAPECRIMADSSSPKALRRLFESVELPGAVVNSVTLEEDRLSGVLPIVREFKTGIVGMPVGKEGIPKTADQRVENAGKLIQILRENEVQDSDIYIDIVVEAAATGWEAPSAALEATRILRAEYPDVHLLAGLSNISFGLPKRGVINQAFLACALMSGADALIMDITNPQMKLFLRAVQMMLGQDAYCAGYLEAFRETEQK